jgi:hypothetical protein
MEPVRFGYEPDEKRSGTRQEYTICTVAVPEAVFTCARPGYAPALRPESAPILTAGSHPSANRSAGGRTLHCALW